jgi:Ca2+-transporting ATPase
MILTDDNFATIVKAVELGRGIYDNLMRYIRYQMGSLFGFILVFLGAGIFNILGGAPFIPLQTLWINFTTNIFGAIGLGFGETQQGLMDRPPRDPAERILPRARMIYVIVVGLIIAVGTLCVIVIAEREGGGVLAHTMGFATFNLFAILFALEAADERRTIFGSLILENGKLIKMTFLSVISTVLGTELGLFQRLLETTHLRLVQWGICLGVSLSIVVVAEIWKLVLRRLPPKETLPKETVELRPALPS